ncbi:hypothetical protein [Streptomyces violaceusniger]|uniref:Uncharacterized protein n=1 Tax=Streptomyces violaceusniger (strain Tu 4113) TaxID=653045 RepID=G2NYS2_STRV4|nr:hypothetical protein [Streptomyces violaceusniger]AEM82367.1 hypothetical protein Strvi_2653 [Streptomyces violaceusniger Tu 4113]
MTDDRSTDFSRTEEDALLDQLLALADDSVLGSLETALEYDAGLAHIFQLYPLRPRRRHRGGQPRVARDRPPQDAIADQQHGPQRP